MKFICMYSNKGGVAKTTTLFNLAAFLSKKDKVLTIDFDPQCNLTELFFAADPELNDPNVARLKGTSIFDAFKKRFAGEGARIEVADLNLACNNNYPNLSILRGDFAFGAAEGYFADAWKDASASHLTSLHEKNTYNSIRNLLEDLVDEHGFKYIFCDLGPNINYATRLAFLSCDGFFIPMYPDRFSHQALTLMFAKRMIFPESIPSWFESHKTNRDFFPPENPIFDGNPHFLGAIMTAMNWDPAGKGVTIDAWERSIKDACTRLLSQGCMVPRVRNLDPRQPFIARIDFLGPLPSIAQAYGLGIFDLTEDHMSGDGNPILQRYRLQAPIIPDEWIRLCGDYSASIKKLASHLSE